MFSATILAPVNMLMHTAQKQYKLWEAELTAAYDTLLFCNYFNICRKVKHKNLKIGTGKRCLGHGKIFLLWLN